MNNKLQQIQLSAKVTENLHGKRLDQALAELFPEHSRSRLQDWNKSGFVMVNEASRRQRDKVSEGEEIVILANIEIESTHQAEDIDLNILYEDNELIILNKPAGLVVHPGAGNHSHTLLNALLHHCPEVENLPRAGIVHRLDKETSGVMVVAKTLEAHTFLVKSLQDRDIGREYQAIVLGTITSGGSVDANIGRHPNQRTKMAVSQFGGKPACTHYRIIKRYKACTHLQLKLESGRTHQIRVHMAHIHHPVFGDPQYGGRKPIKNMSEDLKTAMKDLGRQALHAFRLELTHPKTQEVMSWQAELPDDLQKLISLLENE